MQFSLVLNEICTFSAMHATTALSKFLQIPIGVDMKLIDIKKVDDLNFFDKSSENTVSIFLPITGDLPGASFFIYTEKAALALCDVLFQRDEGSTQKILEQEKSALSEVANIVLGNFLTSFAQFMQLDMLMHRSPTLDCAPFDAILHNRLPLLKEKMQEAVLSISFGFKHINIQGYVLVVFSEEKVNAVLAHLSSPTNI